MSENKLLLVGLLNALKTVTNILMSFYSVDSFSAASFRISVSNWQLFLRRPLSMSEGHLLAVARSNCASFLSHGLMTKKEFDDIVVVDRDVDVNKFDFLGFQHSPTPPWEILVDEF